jgi:predicted nucleic acid-binding protein
VSAFVDTSALYAYLVASERDHGRVRDALVRAVNRAEELWTSSYVLVESAALLQRRIGMGAARDLDELRDVLHVAWVSAELHRRAWQHWLREDRRRLSFVDCVSFEVMRERELTTAVTLDAHFEEAGFRVRP